MTHDLKAIGRRIATVRREMNLSQKDLAAKINISNNHLSNIETGKSAPGFATFLDICTILNADVTYIIGGDIYPSPDDATINRFKRKSPEDKMIIGRIIDIFPDMPVL
ncbi:MAG: helix-turn-helix transcriptional regulator [Ruminococcus sp.]|nr:helix-turn-helix transcriptional regulator [Oscillospiraceae bacterium]MDD7344807.1 helix-turn-helix transcriptional regulator [Ruminococcus sp.]MDY6059961.1 helix-turn-helix transcriptional regulator [Candidatus Fimenecus sp.]